MAEARASFLSSGSVAASVVGIADSVLMSWRRCRFAGVDIEAPEVPYGEEIDLRSRLVRCAAPVMERLQDRLADMSVTAALTNDKGRVLERRDSGSDVARTWDKVYFAPGFSYAETHAGTNGVGTALEEGRPVFVFGPEHFTERSTAFACAGAPIRNPLSRRIEGLINLSCLAEYAHPMMSVLAQEAALDIERKLLDDGSERQRAVLETFLATSRRSTGAVLSVCGDIVIANERASALLTPTDEALLKIMAGEVRPGDLQTPVGMSLTDGRWAQVRCHPIVHGPGVAGAVFELHILDTAPKPRAARPSPPVTLPGLVGRSPAWLDASMQAREAATRQLPLLIVGEAGTGKLALARGAHQDKRSAGHFAVLDCDGDTPDRLIDSLADKPPSGATVVLRHLDRLASEQVASVSTLMEDLLQQHPKPWVVATVGSAAATSDALLRHFDATVTAPPLRHRTDDLEQLVPALLNRLAPGRDVQCGDDAMRVLTRNPWGGNIAELDEVLAAALRQRPAGTVRREDLPASCFTTSRRVLSPMETLERDAIVRTLAEAGGNRKNAAAALGMSRSSLYRKMHLFGISSLK